MTRRRTLTKCRSVNAVAALAAVLLSLSGAAAAAQCTANQVNGRWVLYGSNSGAWSECRLVATDGALTGRCRGTAREPFRLTGSLRLTRACALSGTIEGPDFSQALFGTLQADGEAGAGIIRFGDPDLNLGILFSLVRRP